MPIYAYRCDACGHALDALQKVSDPPLTDCPACGKSMLRKQLTAAGFQLKGSGWYVTDFRGDGKAKKDNAGDGADAAAKPADAPADAAAAAPAEAPKPSASTPEAKPAAPSPAPVPAAAPPPSTSSS